MIIRVYALYNRDPVILWVLGTFAALGIVLCLTLVCAFSIARAEGHSTRSTSDGLE